MLGLCNVSRASWDGKCAAYTRVDVLCGAGRVGEGAEGVYLRRGVRVWVYGLPNGEEPVDLTSYGISSDSVPSRYRKSYAWCSQKMGSKAE